jgi:voltage-gated potassium channel
MKQFDKYIFRILLAAALAAITLGTVVYHFVEKLSWVDAYYFSVVTLATVGYGDIVPKTSFGKVFTTLYILGGVGILTTFISYSTRRRAEKITKHEERKQH